MRAIHFHKGCYIGQEIVERVRSRGHLEPPADGFLWGRAPGGQGSRRRSAPGLESF